MRELNLEKVKCFIIRSLIMKISMILMDISGNNFDINFEIYDNNCYATASFNKFNLLSYIMISESNTFYLDVVVLDEKNSTKLFERYEILPMYEEDIDDFKVALICICSGVSKNFEYVKNKFNDGYDFFFINAKKLIDIAYIKKRSYLNDNIRRIFERSYPSRNIGSIYESEDLINILKKELTFKSKLHNTNILY